MNWIVSLDEAAAADRNLSGSKARGLARMRTNGFPVPEGFVVTVAAFRDFLDANHLTDDVAALNGTYADRDESHITRLEEGIRSAPLARELIEGVNQSYGPLAAPVAVRSSGIAEDSSRSSFAGAFVSVLNCVGAVAILDAVRVCWASAFSGRVSAYREQHRFHGSDWLMGVVVQKMIFADKAGVMFTHDPFGAESNVLIEAVSGGCERIVAGATPELSVSVDRDSRRLVRVEQPLAGVRQFGGGATGLLNRSAVAAPRLLRRLEIEMLIDAGLRLEEVFEGPQDVEWAFVGGNLFLLQTRPLTSREAGVTLQ